MQNSLGRCAQRKKSELINNIRHCFTHTALHLKRELLPLQSCSSTLSQPPLSLSKIGIKGSQAVM